MERINGNRARQFVEARRPFTNNPGTLRGELIRFRDAPSIYVVWTYREPLYIYDEGAKQWFGNETKYSRTSSKHRGQAMPWNVEIEWRDRETMTEIARNGLAGAVRRKITGAA